MNPSSHLLHLRTQQYLQRHQAQLVTVSGAYQNLLTVRAIELVLQQKFPVRPARHDFASSLDLAAAILGTSSPSSFWQSIRQLIGSRLREAVQDPEPAIIIPIIKALRPGQVDQLAQQYPPHLAVLTNTASAHLDYFSDPAERAHEQASLAIIADQSGGQAILNLDEPYLADIRHHLIHQPLTFSCHHPADVHCRRLQRLSSSKITGLAGEVVIKGQSFDLHLPHLLSPIQVSSVLSALAVALVYNIDIKQALHHLRNLRPPGGYLSLSKTSQGATLIDSHRENPPEYLQALLRTVDSLTVPRKILILADLSPLSRYAPQWYQTLGAQAAFADLLLTIGQDSKQLQAAALNTRQGTDTHHFTHARDAAKWLQSYLTPHDTILLAGNPAINLNPILSALHR